MSTWKLALELNAGRNAVNGSSQSLCDAIRGGADLRINTVFRHEEHIEVGSEINEQVNEVAEFGVTYLVDDRWAAGIMSLRQPLHPPLCFHSPPSMSYFLYNQNGQQAIARPFLQRPIKRGTPGPSEPVAPKDMPKYHTIDNWDSDTNAPSQNFIYEFNHYRFYTGGGWQEVLSHDENGAVAAGSLDALVDAFMNGCEIKVGVRDCCNNLLADGEDSLTHELFVQAGSCSFNEGRRIFSAGTHPLIRVKPGIPMRYESRGWDFGWLLAKSDGSVSYRRCDPYTLKFNDTFSQHALRWFVR